MFVQLPPNGWVAIASCVGVADWRRGRLAARQDDAHLASIPRPMRSTRRRRPRRCCSSCVWIVVRMLARGVISATTARRQPGHADRSADRLRAWHVHASAGRDVPSRQSACSSKPAAGRDDRRRRFYEAPARGTRRSAPAALRNREPIAEVLAEWLPTNRPGARDRQRHGRACGDFAERFPNLEWQPSDFIRMRWRRSPRGARSRRCRISASRSRSTPRPRLAARAAADAVLSINMVHISPWASRAGAARWRGAAAAAGAPLILYGPWLER